MSFLLGGYENTAFRIADEQRSDARVKRVSRRGIRRFTVTVPAEDDDICAPFDGGEERVVFRRCRIIRGGVGDTGVAERQEQCHFGLPVGVAGGSARETFQ